LILLDASALIALLAREPAEPAVRAILRGGEATMTSVNLAEVVDVMARRYGISPERTRPVLDPLIDEALPIVELAAAEAWRAGELRAAHYDRASRPLSLADCYLIACAGEGDAVASLDADVEELARAVAVETVALDSG